MGSILSKRQMEPRRVGTDRGTSIAPGARNRLRGDVTVAEIMSRGALFLPFKMTTPMLRCKSMKEGKVQRLPVIAKNGTLAGVISMDDLLVRAELTSLGRQPEISTDEVVSLLVASP